MRRDMPEPERRLWNELRGSRLSGFKFRRQVVIGCRIVDFFCPAKGLVIEVDGDTHDPVADADRDLAMRRDLGFATLRFTNHQVMRNLDGVLEKLTCVLEDAADRWPKGREHHPQPPPLKKRGLSCPTDTTEADAAYELMQLARQITHHDRVSKAI